MDDPLRALVGQEIAGFRLTAMLGEGGMAAVFRGENVYSPSIVRALKVVRPELAARGQFAQRFAEEAVILERLKHPNVVGFYGVRREKREGQELLVMELEHLEGEPLSAVLARSAGSKIALGDAVAWILAASEGVASAHTLGIVHRDLKPENLFLTKSGAIKVLDFGIARAVDDADRAEKLTTAGTVPGSPAYMAPEVCNGAIPAASADVYALGISLYELLLGYHPFSPPGEPMKSSPQLMFAHVTVELPPLRKHRPDAPELLEQILARASAKDPERRFKTAADLADALRSVAGLARGDSGARSTGSLTEFALPQFDQQRTTGAMTLRDAPPKPRVGMFVAIGLAAVACAGGAAAFVMQRRAQSAVPPPSVALSASAPASDAGAPARAETNRWVRIEAPRVSSDHPVLLGIDDDKAPPSILGFRPARKIAAPSASFEIQQHEVTWAEMEAWLAEHPHEIARPSWVPEDAKARERLPATGIPWDAAREYCRDAGGSLPTEEEWELAARGAERRPYSWGSQPIDLLRTRAYVGDKRGSQMGADNVPVAPVMTSEQDQTPGEEGGAVFDLIGNAMEWTADLYRENKPKMNEAWVQEGGMTYRALRGLPLVGKAPSPLPAVGAAYRDSLCATGPCPKSTVLQYVGFRCARRARAPERR